MSRDIRMVCEEKEVKECGDVLLSENGWSCARCNLTSTDSARLCEPVPISEHPVCEGYSG